jgi:lipoprotein signal peptidase
MNGNSGVFSVVENSIAWLTLIIIASVFLILVLLIKKSKNNS